uniref:Cyclic nucleotide-binding domain-containing protein n=1 Tax=Macrostomum lignano TaxID=282301 RepID=A0A1I8IJW9_9PLAT
TDCELLRVDRAKFHALMRNIEAQLRNETIDFLNAEWNFLSQLPVSEKEALVPHLVKENLRPDSLVLKQGERNDWLYFLTSGRCQAYRMLSFQEDGQEKTEAFALSTFDKGDMFGEESPLQGCESSLSVCTKSHVTVYRLHRNQLTVLGRQNLSRLVREHAGTVPTDAQLRQRRSAVRTWEAY